MATKCDKNPHGWSAASVQSRNALFQRIYVSLSLYLSTYLSLSITGEWSDGSV
jgi:hypothetical protein